MNREYTDSDTEPSIGGRIDLSEKVLALRKVPSTLFLKRY